ncbi:MoxR-like ATPases [[Actinomadura] parvosata subsp. kistnae]|uniref:AAA family ATPase n=1 Tax=[Actinomadura] parvosata subsp. kistnae TaxID=1909395 RepID=A0A1V0AE24_9ACTN|nr:MoxR family ATPase [Nonomuraea sp. ATCC 55076]AQZ68474.1 AAA family ATPase [Nonomuraea sp. ATCC 55076]SPL93075.1 MoxR-like ATPases [Actinomadura parvosata subsp. kistnae]
MGDSRTVLEALAIAVSAGVPTLLWGSPGTGKTSAVVALAASLNWPIEVVIGSIREPGDFAGLPVISDGAVRLTPPAWAQRLAAAGHGLLFLDELTTAPPAVQAAMLRVVLERVVGDVRLPDKVQVVAAANPPDEAADGWDLAPPLANRLVHLNWPVDGRHIARGLAVGFPAPSLTGFAQPPSREQVMEARATVAAFLELRPTLALQVPSNGGAPGAGGHELGTGGGGLGTGGGGQGWPSPRSWEAAAKLMAACKAAGAPDDVLAMLVTGTVGEGAALEFLSWLEHLDLPDPAAVLANPDAFELPRRGDRAFAVLTSVVAVAVSAGDVERWDAAWRVIAKAARTAPDVATLAARTLAAHRPPGARIPDALLELTPILRAAGLLDG